MLIEKHTESQKEFHCVFEKLNKAYDRELREKLWFYMRKSGVTEKHILAENVLGQQDSGEVCGWSGRWVQDVGGIMIFVCDCNGQVARRDQAGVSVDYDVCR